MNLLEMYKWVAIVSGGIFLLQLAGNLLGFDSDADVDFDSPDLVDTGGDSGLGNVVLSFVSVRNVIAFLLAFSVTGYFGMKDYGFGSASVIPGCIAGVALVTFNMYIMRTLAKIRRDTSVDEKDLEGLNGVVIFPVLGNRSGQGKVNVSVDGKVMTLFALTDNDTDLSKNTTVVIEEILEGWILLVAPSEK